MNLRADEAFDLDVEAGTIRHKPRVAKSKFSSNHAKWWNDKYVGKEAGTVSEQGYRTVCFNGKRHLAHRLIWEHVNGPVPEGMVMDHINGNRADNRISNLRCATMAGNCQNRGAGKNSKTGIKGVFPFRNGWNAIIRANGRNVFLGTFPTKGLAAVAHAKAALRYHGEYARIGKTNIVTRAAA